MAVWECPSCGRELRRSQVDPAFGLCDHCRKKYRIGALKQSAARQRNSSYSNIPAKKEREKSEQRIRQDYEHMLSQGRDEQNSSGSGKGMTVVMVILGIAIILLVAAIAAKLFLF